MQSYTSHSVTIKIETTPMYPRRSKLPNSDSRRCKDGEKLPNKMSQGRHLIDFFLFGRLKRKTKTKNKEPITTLFHVANTNMLLVHLNHHPKIPGGNTAGDQQVSSQSRALRMGNQAGPTAASSAVPTGPQLPNTDRPILKLFNYPLRFFLFFKTILIIGWDWLHLPPREAWLFLSETRDKILQKSWRFGNLSAW